MKQKGDNEHPVHDPVMKSIETAVSIARLADLKGRTHKPWDAEPILRLVRNFSTRPLVHTHLLAIRAKLCMYLCSQVGSGLSVLIGVCLIGIMVYNAGIVSKGD